MKKISKKIELNFESKSLNTFAKKIDELNSKLEKSLDLIHQLNLYYQMLRKNVL